MVKRASTIYNSTKTVNILWPSFIANYSLAYTLYKYEFVI